MLRGLQPVLDPETYVFVTLPPGQTVPADARPLGRFTEAEGETLILEHEAAQRLGLSAAFPCRRITLGVHSALEAVGLFAAVAQCLTAAGIPANAVSGYYHDHLFVPVEQANAALATLADLATTADQDIAPSSAR